MRSLKRTWVCMMLSLVLACGMLAQGRPTSIYAQETTEPQQSEQTEEREQTEQPVETTESTSGDEIAVAMLNEADVTDTAMITAPNQLVTDGTQPYVIFASCLGGNHTYGIGADAMATEQLGIKKADRVVGSKISLTQSGLGWTINKTDAGLLIQNETGYLTVSEDQTSLTVKPEETISGLTIQEDGKLTLADQPDQMVYLQLVATDTEPQAGQTFGITAQVNTTVFYFGAIEPKEQPDKPQPSDDILYPTLLPQAGFKATIVAPNQVYGDDQYVMFTEQNGTYYAINSKGKRSTALTMEGKAALTTGLTSPDQDVLWTINNNRAKQATNGYYKYIRNSASNRYLGVSEPVLTDEIHCDFYLAESDGTSALLASEDGHYIMLDGEALAITDDKTMASRFYFAKRLQKEQQENGTTAKIAQGQLLRLVDWDAIEAGKTYAIINATEFNQLHYAISGDGRFTRYGADNVTNSGLCPNENIHDIVYGEPCQAKVGDIFYTNGYQIVWKTTEVNGNQATFQNIDTKLYLKPSEGSAASQTASISNDAYALTIEAVEGQAYAYLSNGAGTYLGTWQYITVGVEENAPERCAYYLAEVLSPDEVKNLPATTLTTDTNPNTVSFGGMYSVYQGSQHLLTDATGVENFILMDDGKGNFKPSQTTYDPNRENNYYVTYCADYEADMPTFTDPGQYEKVSLDDYDGFTAEQKAALKAIVPNSYPYISEEEFLKRMKTAGYEVSAECGTDEIMAGVQAAIYTVTNPREDGKQWGYESSDGWAHNGYEVNKPSDYVADPKQAEQDVNTVRDYLWSLVNPISTTAVNTGMITAEGDYFAIITEIDGQKMALTSNTWLDEDEYGNYGGGAYPQSVSLAPYDPNDIRQAWYLDDQGYLHWFPITIQDKRKSDYRLSANIYMRNFPYSSDGQTFSSSFGISQSYYASLRSDYDNTYDMCFPVILDENGYFKLDDPEHKEPEDLYTRYPFIDGFTYPEIKADGSNFHAHDIHPTPSDVTLRFTTEKVYPTYPESVVYDLESVEWKINYNEDGTAYGITITGKINEPMRPNANIAALLYCNDAFLGEMEFAEDQQSFTVTSETIIPDDEEAMFGIVFEQEVVDISVFQPLGNSGWQLQIFGAYAIIDKTIAESTRNVPAKKVWDDDKDHSGDEVVLTLLENGKETGYTLTLNAENNWEGEFKHVPDQRWTFNRTMGDPWHPSKILAEIPILKHEYTVKETNVKPGYKPNYDSNITENKKLKPGASHYVQGVVETADHGRLALDWDPNLFAEYVLGKEEQLMLLNGADTIIMRIPEGRGYFYQVLRLEPAEEAGKYYAYMEFGTDRMYVSLDPSQGYTKENATPIEIWDSTTGVPLETFPTDSFESVPIAFELYENDSATGMAIDLISGDLVSYDEQDEALKNQVFCYEGMFFVSPFPGFVIQLVPIGTSGERFALYSEMDEGYVCWNASSGRIWITEDLDQAMVFGLRGSGFDPIEHPTENHTVINTPTTYLEVSKTVSGSGANENQEFTFTVTLDQDIDGTFGDMTFENGKATFTLKHGMKKIAMDLPDGIGYTVEETTAKGYTTTVNEKNGSSTSGTLTVGEPEYVAFNNKKTVKTENGVVSTADATNPWSWFAMMSMSALGIATLLRQRRQED